MFYRGQNTCSPDDKDFTTINGIVERAINGDGIADQSVIVMTRKYSCSGLFSTIKVLDSAKVITDTNGNFSVTLVNDIDAFVTIVYQGDENYLGSGIFRDYPIEESVIIKVYKFIKFKVLVNNTNPIDENDFIHIDFFAGLTYVVRTGIENFGVDNTYPPEDPLSGGGVISAYEETSWRGTDVNSIVYYSVPETAVSFKIRWFMRKNGVETDGFTEDIPYDIEEINSYTFQY